MQEEITRNESCIRDVLRYNRIEIRDIKVLVGPAVSLYKVYLAPGVKVSAVRELGDDFALAMGVISVRVVTLIDSIGIEVPNRVRNDVPLKAMLESKAFVESDARLPVVIGYSFDQSVKVIDLVDAPHMLVAGATKQGKTMFMQGLRASLEAKDKPVQQVWIDSKAKDANMKDISARLEGLCEEMERRLQAEVKLPYIVVFIDEYADFSVSRKIKTSVIRLAQRGRNAGIHLVLATQRPTVDVISGLIKANFPTRIAFRVASRIDSATILDQPGAEKLIGNGDLLYACGVELERLQAGYIDQS